MSILDDAGGLLGGDGSEIGSTVGAGVGTIFGPVGSVVGGFLGNLFGGKQKYPNAKESADKMRGFGAPEWFVNAAINKAYGYAGPGYLSGARLLKRALADEQRDAAVLAEAVKGATGGQTVKAESFWRSLAVQLRLTERTAPESSPDVSDGPDPEPPGPGGDGPGSDSRSSSPPPSKSSALPLLALAALALFRR